LSHNRRLPLESTRCKTYDAIILVAADRFAINHDVFGSKRLARILLLLAHFGKDGKPEVAIPKISQETLAEMVGTTRGRANFFMNRFRKLGFVRHNGGLEVHSSLLNVVLHD
jgi:CRP-like cAMP-binding protein